MPAKEDTGQLEGCDLAAGHVYILMKKAYHVSRNVRLQWFLQHLDSKLTIPQRSKHKSDQELVVLSVVPHEPPPEWSPESSHLYRYIVTSSTEVIFISETYSAVYCLDMSPSISTVDIQRGRVMIDEILISLRRSVEGIINPFKIPGTVTTFEPDIFVTVIVHTPFFTTPAQQVLVQGWKVTKENMDFFLLAIEKQLQLLEDNIAHVSGLVHDQLAEFRLRQAESERLVGGLFEENTEKLVLPSKTEISMVSPDSGFINLLRYGMLALRLLPPSSCPNLIVVTDGMITLPDIHVLDSVLTQLRTNAVAVSFLHVGSQFHPHCALGLIPYVELMQFIASATMGAYIPSPPAVTITVPCKELNVYQYAFLTWSFVRGNLMTESCGGGASGGEWSVSNRRFYGNREPQLLTKKQGEDTLNASLSSVLCCRMREGYMIKSVYLKDGTVDICLVLPWSNHIYIEYYVTADWPSSDLVRYWISIKAPYEFLHDITCLMKKPFQSPYRQAVVSRFWSTLKTLNQSDLLLSHLDSFPSNPASYTLPDSIRSGLPLFYLPSDSTQPVVSSNDPSCPQFAQFWRLICVLDPGVWQKWLHTHRLGVILQHDQPLPQFLHTANPNGRFQSLQCRYAASMLFNFLKDWTSFVLIENHSYIKLFTSGDAEKEPTWFYIIRVTSKPPCAVLHVAFLGDTPGYLRNQIVETLKEKICELRIPLRQATKEQRKNLDKSVEKLQQTTECCILLKKPLEKMLIRYERMPSEFGTVIFPDGTQPLIAAKPLRPPSSLVTTLSRYLHHRRWVWSASARPGSNYSLGITPLTRILATLTEMRLKEGFRFAHSTAGIVNMVLEVQMKCFDEEMGKADILPCVIQYVLFPPHLPTVSPKDAPSDDEAAEEPETEQQDDVSVELISECWIEPQHGIVTHSPPNRSYMENLRYYQLADVMWRNDAECISSLLTFEHLRLMCQDSSVGIPEAETLDSPPNPLEQWPHAVALADERIQRVPFAYNLMNILPKCQQAQLLFSLFIQDICGNWDTKCSADVPNCLLMEIFYENLKELHDREMKLNKEDSKKLIDLIIQRERDHDINPVPFTKEKKDVPPKSDSGRKTSSSCDSTETIEQMGLPVIGDWNRMISWATESDLQTNTVVESIEEGFEMRHDEEPLADVAEGSETMTTSQLPFWHERCKVRPIEWKCFIKAVTATHCILTFIPASFQDVKALMLQTDHKGFKKVPPISPKANIPTERVKEKTVEESSLNPEAEPFRPIQTYARTDSAEPEGLQAVPVFSSPASSRSRVSDNFTAEHTSHGNLCPSESYSLWEFDGKHSDPEPPLRLRANSWDTTRQVVVDSNKSHQPFEHSSRARTRSVGSRAKCKMKGKQSAYSIGSINKMQLQPPLTGAITLPLFMYDCSVPDLIEAVTMNSTSIKQKKDIFINRTLKSDSEEGCSRTQDDDRDSPAHTSEASETLTDELDLKEHSKMVIQGLKNAFVVSLFKSLRTGHSIHSLDVQTAVDECEESSVEINITDYIKTVCGHLKELCVQTLDEDVPDKIVPLSVFKHPGPCLDYKHLHKLIRSKFLRILTTSFKAVPSNPKYYFCSPTWERERQVVSTPFGQDESCRTLEASHDFENLNFQNDMPDFRCDQSCILGANVWEAVGSVTTPEDARTSLLSNMDSDSISNFPEDESMDDIAPLFLHLNCSLQSTGNTNSCSMKIIPTCLNELLDVADNKFSELNLKDMDVALSLVLTAKSSACSQPHAVDVTPTGSTDAGDQVLEARLQHLPEHQQRSVTTCVREIEWLMHDEIAAFLLDAVPVSEQTLQFVSNHVASSANRPSCLFESVPLQFVFGADHSMPRFLKDFAHMRLAGYCLKQEGDFYYLVKDENSLKAPKSGDESLCSLGQGGDFWITATGMAVTGEDKKILGCPSWIRTGDVRGSVSDMNKSVQTGWSSITAWHNDVSTLMENGLAAEDVYDVDPHVDDTCDWLTDLEKRRTILPNFWLIMKVDKESVSAYFHCRFLELETQKVKLYSLVQRNVVKTIRQVCKTVNQIMLLQNLHNTRLCNRLLEPESNDDVWKPNANQALQKAKSIEEGVPETENVAGGCPEVTAQLFMPGWFTCGVVWQTHFALHPRLKTGPGKPRLSRGIQALQTVLNRFSVNNRKNMFVYQDQSENVFYLRLHEKTRIRTIDVDDISPGSVSRSSSINSLNREYNKRLLEEQASANKEPARPRLKSFGDGDGYSSRQEDFITLKVHGISEAGPEVKFELIEVLQNRLDDAVLEVVSVMLARNPMCKLSPEDVHFIQKPNHSPDSIIQFSIPSHALQHLQALSYYLRQNLLQFLYMPKYTDSRPHYHFQDYSYPNDASKRIPEDSIFLYNQSPASGNKGIACIGFALVECDSSLMQFKNYYKPDCDAHKNQPLSVSDFHILTNTYESLDGVALNESIEFRVWKQGRVNMESLRQMLKSAVRHSLWDLLMEYNLLTSPLSRPLPTEDEEKENGDDNSEELSTVYQTLMVPWMKLAVKLGVPAVKAHFIPLAARHPVGVTLKEIHSLVSVNETTGFVFYKKGEEEDSPFYSYRRNSNDERPISSCLVIGRNVTQWKACLSDDPEFLPEKLDYKAQTTVVHFPPLLDISSDAICFVPRQRFLLAIVSSKNITIYTYNWAKDRIELLKKHVANLGHWLSARCRLLTGILAQKMGLFHNQPCTRKASGQGGGSVMNHIGDVESLLSFSLHVTKHQRTTGSGVSQLSEVFRDSKPMCLKKANTSDPVIINAQQIIDTKNLEKRDHQKELYMMWQARGATPNIPLAEDILCLFIQHSRTIHYCLTPLLFLPRWRIQSAATRDHSLKVGEVAAMELSSSESEDKWHQQLCANFVHEYKQYLQTLGFIPIQIGPPTPRKGGRSGSQSTSIGQEAKNCCYLQKSLLGGILLFELFLSEPFFHAKLHALECSRLQASTPLISQFTLSFLDECDRVKVLMHLHSFTYDYHLRCLHWFISDQQALLRPGYHLTSFLDDFLKYYSKAPNYARSLVHADTVYVHDIATPAMHVFNYLLKNEKDYKMEVYRMLPVTEPSSPQDGECVLVQLSQTPHITYKDAHDMEQTDDFDVTLIVSQEDNPDPSVLVLQYYLLLTSGRELYPKLEIERKLGKFCTVSIASPSFLSPISVAENTIPDSNFDEDIEQSSEVTLDKSLLSPTDNRATATATQHLEIRQECVNYLGYYSSHEQLMQQLILEQAEASRKHIKWMTGQGALDCRTHLLWNKLLSTSLVSNALSYGELVELCELAEVQQLSAIDSKLQSVLVQSMSWYQSLVKVLTSKYTDHCRTFFSPDQNTQHLLILHPRFLDGFVMLTLELHLGRGGISVVCRKAHQHDVSATDLYSLIEGVVNACCFHLWAGLL